MQNVPNTNVIKKVNLNPSFLEILYLIVLLILLIDIVIAPTLITGPANLMHKFVFDEELIEGSLITVLLVLSFLLLNLYKREVKIRKDQIDKINNDKKLVEEKLNDAFAYIGRINVQIEEIRSIFNQTNKFPETNNDFKKILFVLSERILGIVNLDWCLIRIIKDDNQRTIKEHLGVRFKFALDQFPHISNKKIIENNSDLPYNTILSKPQNLNITVCCVLPNEKLSKEQRILTKAVINQISMLFIIFKSEFYKNKI